MTANCTDHPDEGCEAFLDRAAARCRERGATLTPIRRTVLGLLHGSSDGLKAYDLLARFKALRPSATPPTVYRALDFLIEHELVHKIARLNQFVACRHGSHHHPGVLLVCRHCRKVTELDDVPLANALAHSVTLAGHELDGQDVEIGTVCPSCAAARVSEAHAQADMHAAPCARDGRAPRRR